MRVLKPLGRDGYSKELYVAHTSQSYTITSGAANNPPQVTIDVANQPPSTWVSTGEIGYVNNNTGVYSYQLFSFIKTKLYSSQSLVGYGTESVAITKYTPTGSLFVFNLMNDAIGDGVVEGSFSIQNDAVSPKILDDGYGRLYVNNTGSVVGNIFYKQGIAVVQANVLAPTQSISTSGLQIKPYVPLIVAFSSSTNIYENTVVCKIEPSEFNTTWFNPSLRYFKSVTGSYMSGSTKITYTDYRLNVNPTASATASSGQPLVELFDSGTLTPYVTTIGLYQDYELVAVAKMARPIPRTLNVPQTFIVKFDT